ncbi:MAG: hypothetical protein ACTMIR_13370 [Cellulomonadaceae bacterium]
MDANLTAENATSPSTQTKSTDRPRKPRVFHYALKVDGTMRAMCGDWFPIAKAIEIFEPRASSRPAVVCQACQDVRELFES